MVKFVAIMSFTFKRFSISDGHCAMKVGTDSVLLAAWCPLALGVGKIVDVGAGSGILALSMAMRTEGIDPAPHILAVEIDPEAAADCLANAAASPWGSRVDVLCASFSDSEAEVRAAGADLIISNPPFFSTALRSPQMQRAAARHAGELGYATLVRWSARMLSPCGSLCMVSEYSAARDIVFEAELAGLSVVRRCDVEQIQGRGPTRVLWQMARRSSTSAPAPEEKLAVREAGGREYTTEYLSLTNDFYL